MMRRLILPVCLFGTLAFASNGSAAPPVKVDFNFRFDVEFQNRPQYKNLAPWYSYFPHDPYVNARPLPYPTWPQAWPPATPGKVELPGPARGPMVYQQPSYNPIVPTSYAPMSGQYAVPSYWYGR